MYHTFKDDSGEAFGSFETFYMNDGEARDLSADTGNDYGPGWYWWACFPGCMPDGDQHGPFKTEADAIADANEEA
jgi:hypothetical protein